MSSAKAGQTNRLPRAHIVGAGLAGLSCAVHLARAGHTVTLYEASAHAGGRCRSYHDAKLDRLIDNGNHILLSANHAALDYLKEISSRGSLTGPETAAFPFFDLASGERWTLRPGDGAIPWWIFSTKRRIPGTRPAHYLSGLKLAFAGSHDRVEDIVNTTGPLWQRFWEPLTVAALNTAPREASARLLWLVLKETFIKGAAHCRPLIARQSLADTFVTPALRLLREAGAEIRFGERLRALSFEPDRIGALDFAGTRVTTAPSDRVVLALPPPAVADLLSDLTVPQESSPIVNAHIRLPQPPTLPENLPFLGLVGGTADWLFLRDDVVSLTVSAAEALADESAERIAAKMWHDTARALGLDPALDPPVRVIKEKRATFAQTPAALDQRASARTAWHNLYLAGDWTDTGYPATIESAVRSGRTAAKLCVGEPT